MSAKAVDPSYGNVSAGSYNWMLQTASGQMVSLGSGAYNATSKQWEAGLGFVGDGLAAGEYRVWHQVASDRGRVGFLTASLMVGGGTVVVNGTIKDSVTQLPVSGAQVALFSASGANGLWTLVNSSYGGVVPPLSALLSQLTPLKPAVITGPDGAFSWLDVPAGSSCVLVAAKSGYADARSGSFSLPATLGQTTKNLGLAPSANTLADAGKDVSMLRDKSEALLNYDASVAGRLSERYYADNLYSFNVSLLSKFASVVGVAGGGVASLPEGVSALSQDGLVLVSLNVAQSMTEGLAFDVAESFRGWLTGNTFPANELAYRSSVAHTDYLSELNTKFAAFNAGATAQPLSANFSTARAADLREQVEDQADKVMNGGGIYIVSPNSAGPIRGFTFTNMADSYFAMSRWLGYAQPTETVLSSVQLAAGSVLIYSGIATATGIGAPVGAPVAGAAAVVNQGAGIAKKVVGAGKILLKADMAKHYALSICATYPNDNESATETFGDYVSLLQSEAGSPFYLSRSNRFRATTTIDMNFALPGVPAIYAWGGLPGLDVAEQEAIVQVKDNSTLPGGGTLTARCVSYTTWSPITLKSALGFGEETILESSETVGPAVVPAGGAKQFTMTYRGHSKNLFSLFRAHVFAVDTYLGPWRVDSTYKPFYVLAPGEVLRPLSLSANPVALVDQTQLVAPAVTKKGRVRTKDLLRDAVQVVQLATNALTAASPALTAPATIETNFYAVNFKLFAPADADVSLLVSDSLGRRVGYSSATGLTYTELPATVTDQSRRPVNVRIIAPPVGESYTIEVSLLSPGPDPVTVTVFSEAEEVSSATLAASASQLVLDGDRGSAHEAQLNYGEISGQQPLTKVSATFSNVVKWIGSAQMTCSSNAFQLLGDIPAQGNGSVAWHLRFPDTAEYGKYGGTVRATSDQTVPLETPVLALVRRATRTVSTFMGTNDQGGLVQTTLVIPVGGSTQAWVHVPAGYYVLHGRVGLVGASTNLLNPQIDIGADGTAEWAFSGKFDVGAVADNVEGGFNRYLTNAPASTNGVEVPIRVTANTGEQIQFNGVQLFLEAYPFHLEAPVVQTGGSVHIGLKGQVAATYTVEVSTNLTNWSVLTNRVASGGIDIVVDAGASGQATRFYRAVLE